MRLEDRNFLPWFLCQIIIQCEQYHEGEEQAGGRQEVPDVVVVIEVEQLALRV